MRKSFIWLTSALVGLTLVGPVLAAETPAVGASPSEPAKTTAPKSMRTRHLRGEVVSVDQAAKTLTVKRERSKNAKDMTFTVESDAAAALADLKPGDHVKIGYVAGQGHLTAKTVAKNEHTAKK